MKALCAIVLVAFVISIGAVEDSDNQKEKRNIQEFQNTHQAYRQELLHSEYMRQPHRYDQKPYEKEPRRYMILVNEEEYQRYNKFHQDAWESQRVHNGYKHFNHHDNYQINPAPEPHKEQKKPIIYQAVPYPVEVSEFAHRAHQRGKQDSDDAVEIQQSIPIYTERQIHYQMKHPHTAQEQIAEKLVFVEAKQENRLPQRNAVHGERPYPEFMQYPILIAKTEQRQRKPAWH